MTWVSNPEMKITPCCCCCQCRSYKCGRSARREAASQPVGQRLTRSSSHPSKQLSDPLPCTYISTVYISLSSERLEPETESQFERQTSLAKFVKPQKKMFWQKHKTKAKPSKLKPEVSKRQPQNVADEM